MEPQNQCADDELQLLMIFPSEVWDMILQNVKDAQTYHKVRSAFIHFHCRLFPRATQILFLEVMKVFLEYSSDCFTKTNQWNVARQVCHAWKKAMNEVMQTPQYFIQDSQRFSKIRGLTFSDQPLLEKYLRFISSVQFTQFEGHFDPTHLANDDNPFVRRKVQLYLRDIREPFQRYLSACLQFLQKYGHHIWICIINLNLQTNNALDFYNRGLSSVLELMPNLQALQIVANRNVPYNLHDRTDPASPPSLPHLEYIGINTYAEPHLVRSLPFVQPLLQRNLRVKYVDIMNSAVEINVFLEVLPNLRAIAFSYWNWHQLQGFANSQYRSQVDRLWLNMTWLAGTSEQLFQALERHFSQSLVELHLKVPDNKHLTAQARLTFPKLRTFHLEMESPQKLDLLLPLKDTLEKLILAMNVEPDKNNHQFEFTTPAEQRGDENKFQVYKFWKNPQKSSIWSLFPKLRLLQIKLYKGGNYTEKYSCTRK